VIHGFRKEAPMNRDQFWLTDTQFSKIEPHLPTDTRGKARIDDRGARSAAPTARRREPA
jgi:hypothetical protein